MTVAIMIFIKMVPSESWKVKVSHKALNHFHNAIDIQRVVLVVRRIAATGVICTD